MTGQRRIARRGPRTARWWRESALNVGAIVGLICILSAIGAAAFGIRPLVFRSGSMEPAISTGALALSHSVPADDVAVGDVVSVLNADGVRITHRVTAVKPAGRAVELTLKGDANQVPDAETYTVSSVDRVVLDVPYVGYVVSALSGPVGIFAGGALVTVLGLVAFGPRRGSSARGGVRKATAVLVVVGAGLGVAAGPGTTSTLAAFTDSAVMTTGAFTARTVAAPDSATCSVSSPAATITWPEKNADYDYEVVLKRANGTVVSTKQVTGTGVAQTYTAPADFGFGGLAIGTYDFTVEVRSYLASATTWRSPTVVVASKKIRVNVLQIAVSLIANTLCV